MPQGLHLVVATPGRLVDHMKHTTSFDFSKLQVTSWLTAAIPMGNPYCSCR